LIQKRKKFCCFCTAGSEMTCNAACPRRHPHGRALKGFFPHLFNTNDKFGYRGPVPDTAFFSPDTMTPSTTHEFLAWHAERSAAGDYDFDSEILKYCEIDVTILALGVMQFRAMVMEVAGFCPFSKCMTLSSTAMRIFKKRFLAEYFSAEDEAGNPVVLTKRDDGFFTPDGRGVAMSDYSSHLRLLRPRLPAQDMHGRSQLLKGVASMAGIPGVSPSRRLHQVSGITRGGVPGRVLLLRRRGRGTQNRLRVSRECFFLTSPAFFSPSIPIPSASLCKNVFSLSRAVSITRALRATPVSTIRNIL
jgi:hypothetical protein